MSFWGVEVKPGKPYTHIHDNLRGPLRLSQVTLGDGEGTKRSVLQCNVGDKSPVLLCSLLPGKFECCGMDLQFEECYEVVFSVVGPRSVHLAGYFVDISSKRRPGYPSDSDSFGEDIGETESEKSGSHSSLDRYESDFIDDDEDGGMLHSIQHANGVSDKKMSRKKDTHRHTRRKHRISDSDDGDDESQQQKIIEERNLPSSESDDVDFFFNEKETSKEQGDEIEGPKKKKKDKANKDKSSQDVKEDGNGEIKEKEKKRKKSSKEGTLEKSTAADSDASKADIPKSRKKSKRNKRESVGEDPKEGIKEYGTEHHDKGTKYSKEKSKSKKQPK